MGLQTCAPMLCGARFILRFSCSVALRLSICSILLRPECSFLLMGLQTCASMLRGAGIFLRFSCSVALLFHYFQPLCGQNARFANGLTNFLFHAAWRSFFYSRARWRCCFMPFQALCGQHARFACGLTNWHSHSALRSFFFRFSCSLSLLF